MGVSRLALRSYFVRACVYSMYIFDTMPCHDVTIPCCKSVQGGYTTVPCTQYTIDTDSVHACTNKSNVPGRYSDYVVAL